MQTYGVLKQNPKLVYLIELLAEIGNTKLRYRIMFLLVQLEMALERVPLQEIHTKADERQILVDLGQNIGEEEIKHYIRIVKYSTYQKWIADKNYPPVYPHYSKRGPKPKRNIREIALAIYKQTMWGCRRISREMQKLRLPVSPETVRKILKEQNIYTRSSGKIKEWFTVLKANNQSLLACDLFTIPIKTIFGQKLKYILFFINIKTRKVYFSGLTTNPDKQWMLSQAEALIPLMSEDIKGKTILIRDRDCKYAKNFDKLFKKHGIQIRLTPPRAPDFNAYAESFVGKIRAECLNYFVFISESQLRYVIKEYVEYYNTVRPHSGLNNRCIGYTPRKKSGVLRSKEFLGGLLRHFYWE
jgi:putative transposase